MRSVFNRRFVLVAALAAALTLPLASLWAQSADRPALKELLASTRATITEITTADGFAMLTRGAATFVDVRTDEEWTAGHLPGALHLDRGKLEFAVETALPDKAAPIVVYCKSGDRGALSAATLQGMGYTNVKNMTGGFVAWQKAGYEVAK
jgi:rhodanese-related sulfurtransferase